MPIDWGTVPAGSVLPFPFTSYAGSTGASVTLSGLAVTDIEVYKGTSVTQRSSDSGYALIDTDGIDIDGVTGLHGFSIDTGDNTDAGFYAVGSFFYVVVSTVTIDSQTVTFLAGTFRLGPAESVTGYPKADVSHFAGTATTASGGRPEVNLSHIAGSAVSTTTAQLGVNVVQISGDATSADNLESYTDGTTPAPVNVTQISGDATAADNLEAALDGTGGVTITAAVTGNITGNLSGSVGSVTGAVGSVTGNVGGNVAGSVGSVTAGVTVTTNNDKSGYTASTVSDKTGYSLAADQSSVTVGTVNSANVKKINNVTLTGDGSGTPWGPA